MGIGRFVFDESNLREKDGLMNDAAIVELASVTAYFNFINRIALGLASGWTRR